MEQAIKQRLIGAIVLVALVVIVLPFVFDGRGVEELPGELFDMPDSRLDGKPPPAKPPLPDAPRAKKIEDLKSEAKIRNLMTDQRANGAPAADDAMSAEPAAETPPAPPSAAPPAPPQEEGIERQVRRWRVQLASYGSRQPAADLAARLNEAGHRAVVGAERDAGGAEVFVVVLEVEDTYDNAAQLVRRLDEQHSDINAPIIRRQGP